MDSLGENGFDDGSEPPNKRARNDLPVDLVASNSNPPMGIEVKFYKTRLCCRFQLGVCPSAGNCNFAHTIEELRNPRPYWQKNWAAYKQGKSTSREVCQVPVLGFSENERQGSIMEQQYTINIFPEEGCDYLHAEHHEERESAVIYLVPGNDDENVSNVRKSTWSSTHWKTKICIKFEKTGYCLFGSSCKYAHGAAELRCYDGTLMKAEAKNSSTDTKEGALPAKAPCVPHSYRIKVPSRRLPNVVPKTTEAPIRKWKGPDKISKIYGDWLDDL